MLIEFSVENFLTFSDKQTLKFPIGTNIVCIFGHNAVGKTNFLKAFNTFQNFYLSNSADFNKFRLLNNNYTPYRLNDEKWLDKPTRFGIKLNLNDKTYTYEFSFKKEYIYSEKLDIDGNNCFEKTDFDTLKYSAGTELMKSLATEGRKIETYTSELSNKQLLLPLLVFRNVSGFGFKELDNYINNNLRFLFDRYDDRKTLTSIIISSGISDELLLAVLKNTDNTIVNKKTKYIPNSEKIKLKIDELEKSVDGFRKERIKKELDYLMREPEIVYNLKDENGKDVEFNFASLSSGTIKMLYLIIHLVDVSKKRGIFLVDEIEGSINVFIMRYFLALSKKTKAQLIFTTHSVELLDILDKREILILKRDEKKFATKLEQIEDSKLENLREAYLTGHLGNMPNIE